MIQVDVQNQSTLKGLCRRDVLRRIAQRVAAGEGFEEDAEVSVLLCDDAFIAELNAQYRHKTGPTDVLSFPQEGMAPGVRVLGDIIISLETVTSRCVEIAEQRAEVKLLFCHGLLHLLGYVHDSVEQERVMRQKQAEYLDLTDDAAWLNYPAENGGSGQSRGGGVRAVGRR